jgi:hypothetical protein
MNPCEYCEGSEAECGRDPEVCAADMADEMVDAVRESHE